MPIDRINFFDLDPNGGDELPPPPAEPINGHSHPPEYLEHIPLPVADTHPGGPITVNGEIVPPEFSDDALSLRFVFHFANAIRYVGAWGRWMLWDGAVWRKDDTLLSQDLVRRTCRAAASEAQAPALQTRLASAAVVFAVEKLVRSDRRISASIDQWDADPWKLNTPDGIVDLTTGELLPHDPAQHMTKSAAIGPADTDAEHPVWSAFLDRVTRGNAGLQGYLQRVAGYALTGSIREQALFFAYGTGGNGKGTFLNTIQGIMGDYAIVSPAETFTASSQSRHLTELARLMGARLVVAQETEEGKQLAEARVKAITGGDPITANFMRQDHFTFLPQFKLFISGNHKPNLRNVDTAIRRRFNMIPFDVEIPAADRDPELPDKLRAEWPAILRWMITGCLDWQHVRLQPPAAVLDTTADYFDTEDATGNWIQDACQVGTTCWAPTADLFASWSKWSKQAGEHPGTMNTFTKRLEAKGFHRRRLSRTGPRGIDGISLVRVVSPHENEADYE